MPSRSTGRWDQSFIFWGNEWSKWMVHCYWCGHVLVKYHWNISIIFRKCKNGDRCCLVSESQEIVSLHNLCIMYSFFRTCAKWLQKPSPQDRPVLKLSLEELPILVSVHILLFYIKFTTEWLVWFSFIKLFGRSHFILCFHSFNLTYWLLYCNARTMWPISAQPEAIWINSCMLIDYACSN